MKWSCFSAAPLLFALLCAPALAAPRVGTHDGYTRVVFALPQVSAIRTLSAPGKVTVTLGTAPHPALKPERGVLSAPGVTGYAVKGRTVTLTLGPGHGAVNTSVLRPSGGQGARLVIDVPARASAREAVKSAVIPATPTAKPAAVIRTAGTAQARSQTRRPRVVIDAGHGGVDPGMVSQWVTEKQVTLDVALRVRDLLRARGVDVVMVRESDRDLSRDKATDLDLRSNLAKTGEIAAYISIHVNSGGPAAQGIETYYFGQPIGGANRSLAVQENGGGDVGRTLTRQASNTAQSMLGDILAQAKLSFSQQLAARVQANLVASTGAVNRGVHTDAFYVIRSPNTAAILTEIGFGSSSREGPLLATSAYRSKVAGGIAQAILEFLHVK